MPQTGLIPRGPDQVWGAPGCPSLWSWGYNDANVPFTLEKQRWEGYVVEKEAQAWEAANLELRSMHVMPQLRDPWTRDSGPSLSLLVW